MRTIHCILPRRSKQTGCNSHPLRFTCPRRSLKLVGVISVLAIALIATSAKTLEAQGVETGAKSIPMPANMAETFQVAGATFPKVLTCGDGMLQLVGSGVRKRLRLNMYAVALYCTSHPKSHKDIIELDAPAAVRLELVSNLVSKETFENAVAHGFRNSTNNMPDRLKAEIAQFLNAFVEPFKKTDVFEFAYQPGIGTRVLKNGEVKTTVKGTEFKQALFGIWIGDSPIDEVLKNDLLTNIVDVIP